MEERMVLHVDHDVEIARRSAGRAVFPFAVEAQPLPGRDAGRDLRGELAFAGDPTRAPARLARLADDAAGAAARRTGARDGQEPLLEAELPGALALLAHFGRAARGRTRSAAGFAGLFARDLNRGLGPGERFLERDFEVVAQIGSALRAAAAAPAAEHVAEP